MSSIKRLVPLHAVELSTDPANGRIGETQPMEELAIFIIIVL